MRWLAVGITSLLLCGTTATSWADSNNALLRSVTELHFPPLLSKCLQRPNRHRLQHKNGIFVIAELVKHSRASAKTNLLLSDRQLSTIDGVLHACGLSWGMESAKKVVVPKEKLPTQPTPQSSINAQLVTSLRQMEQTKRPEILAKHNATLTHEETTLLRHTWLSGDSNTTHDVLSATLAKQIPSFASMSRSRMQLMEKRALIKIGQALDIKSVRKREDSPQWRNIVRIRPNHLTKEQFKAVLDRPIFDLHLNSGATNRLAMSRIGSLVSLSPHELAQRVGPAIAKQVVSVLESVGLGLYMDVGWAGWQTRGARHNDIGRYEFDQKLLRLLKSTPVQAWKASFDQHEGAILRQLREKHGKANSSLCLEALGQRLLEQDSASASVAKVAATTSVSKATVQNRVKRALAAFATVLDHESIRAGEPHSTWRDDFANVAQ